MTESTTKEQKTRRTGIYLLPKMMRPEGLNPKQRRGIYLLPNLLTTMAMCSGLYAINAAINGRTGTAAVAIFAAIILDGLDGRVARMINAESDFGQQYDSLSDLISFGMAPAILTYYTFLNEWGTPGLSLFFMYVLATALRLARFNAQSSMVKVNRDYFQGLPSPAAAGLVAGYNWLPIDSTLAAPGGALLLLLISALMVSTLRYPSFKSIELHGRVPFFALVIIAPILIIIATNAHYTLFGLCCAYAVFGVCNTVFSAFSSRKRQNKSGDNETSSPPPDA